MAIRKQFKRFQSKVREKSSQMLGIASATTPTPSLPNASVGPPNTDLVPTSFFEDVRTSFIPTPPVSVQPSLSGIPPVPSSHVKVGCRSTQPIAVSPEISVTLPSASNPFNQTCTVESIPNQDIFAPSVAQATQLNVNTLPNLPVKGQGDAIQPAYTFLPASPPTISSLKYLAKAGDISVRPASPPRLPVALSNDNPTLQALLHLPDFETRSGLAYVPVNSAPAGIGHSWKYLRGLQQVLSDISEGFAPLKALINEFGEVIGAFEAESEAGYGYTKLKKDLEELFRELSTHLSGKDIPSTMTKGMYNLCMVIREELAQISRKQEFSKGGRLLRADQALDEIVKCYQQIQRHLERLKLNAQVNMLQIAEEQRSESWLGSLLPSVSACYNSAQASQVSRRECTPATRVQVLLELDTWRHDKKQGNMYWLNGMAGTGKTTIATSLCAMLDKSHELGASFFCTRLLPECRNVNLILPTIAYQLARFSYPLHREVSQALRKDPDLPTKSLSSQLEGLIIDPLRNVSNTLPPSLVVVLDALDECEDSQGVGVLLELLARHTLDLPLKVFVSSRPEPQIRQKIGGIEQQLILHNLEESIVKEDIKLYLEIELNHLALPVSTTDIATLVKHAGILFIYAATIVRYITSATSPLVQRKRIATALNAAEPGPINLNKTMDLLYSTILTSAFGNENLDLDELTNMKLVLDTVVCAQEPLTVTALAKLLGLEDREWVKAALEPLWSVLQLSGADDLVTTLHASFPDYMLDPGRSGGQGCQKERHHSQLAELCFNRIKSNKSQLNICGLESSFVFDREVPDLEERVRSAIPPDLSYACYYWAAHLALGGYSNARADQLREFLSERLLLWMEVLNLKNRINASASMLAIAQDWDKVPGFSQELKQLIHDAWRFATTFATHDVMQSTPHLYASMLASWPTPGPLANRYISRTKRLARVRGTGMDRRQLALLSTMSVGSSVLAVAFSPDGMQIVSGSDDDRVRLWDGTTGKLIMNPLEGHIHLVSAVAFSPDGMRIVSGSHDMTIRLWNAATGKPGVLPLEGHTSSINSVSFSPDGLHIVSGSNDRTVRVWDATTGKPAMEPLEGHTSSVESAAFSPDGMYIVSGSYDTTIRLWDATTGQPVMGPLEGHTRLVSSVSFSPDGMRIVSSSHDMTIRVWDATTGKLVIGPLKGHTKLIRSAAFSPDGMRIVSGAYDRKILIWDATTGKKVMNTLEGHTSSVNSVAFSPDGMRVVSGSYDSTIRLWDTTSGEPDGDPLEGHAGSVWSVAFSPDGKRIVSGSYDSTVRLWDATNGGTFMDPLEGHAQSVNSVAFSPDGTSIASGSSDGTIRLWDATAGKPVMNPLEGHTCSVNSVAFSPDGTHIVSCSHDRTLRLWNTSNGMPVMNPLKGHTDWVQSVAFSPDGKRIVSGSSDSTIRLWDTSSGLSVMDPLEGHAGPVYSAAFSPDGTLIASASTDQTVRLWDAKNGKQVLAPLDEHTGPISSVAFSPDGMYIASSSFDQTVRVWDIASGKIAMDPFKGHTSPVISVAFSPDGLHIVSGSWDNTIRVWDLSIDLPQLESCKPCQALNCSWTLDENGWVRDDQRRLLLWLPVDLRHRLLRPQNPFLISTEGSVKLDFGEAHIGESWADCYCPR